MFCLLLLYRSSISFKLTHRKQTFFLKQLHFLFKKKTVFEYSQNIFPAFDFRSALQSSFFCFNGLTLLYIKCGDPPPSMETTHRLNVFFATSIPNLTMLNYTCSLAATTKFCQKRRKNTFYRHFPFYTVYST